MIGMWFLDIFLGYDGHGDALGFLRSSKPRRYGFRQNVRCSPRILWSWADRGKKKEYVFFWWFKLPVDGIGSPSFRPISFPAWHFAIAPPGSERGNFLPEMMVWSHFSTESQFCSIGVDNFDILYHNLFKICWNGTEWNVSIMILIDHSPDTNISRWNLNPKAMRMAQTSTTARTHGSRVREDPKFFATSQGGDQHGQMRPRIQIR